MVGVVIDIMYRLDSSVPTSTNFQIEVEEKHFLARNVKDAFVISQTGLAFIFNKIADSSAEGLYN